jgi:hypothetical protein
MEYRYDFAFGDLVFTKDGSFKCPVCRGLTPNQRNLKKGEQIVCSECESIFKKEKWVSVNYETLHGARFVMYGPRFHVCVVMKTKSST